MTDTQKRAAIYARTAAVQEHAPNVALAQQIHECKEFCIRQGYQLTEVYQEVGSGNAIDSETLQALLQAAKAGSFDVVIVRSFDRLSRNDALVFLLLSTLEGCGVTCISVTEQDAPTEFDEMFSEMVAVLEKEAARIHKEMISARIRAGRKAKQTNATNHQQ